MPVNAQTWTLSDLINRVNKDLDLESEKFYKPALMTEAVNSAITNVEKIVINEYNDYLLAYQDYNISADQDTLTLPTDLYMFRIRGIYYKRSGFDTISNVDDQIYKIRKISLEDIMDVNSRDAYRYRLFNNTNNGQEIQLYPPIRSDDAGTAKIRLFYIRHFARLTALTDVLDVPYPEYILDYLRKLVMIKEGHPLLPEIIRNLAQARLDIMKDMKFLSDDEEDTKLEPNRDTLTEFGSQLDGY
jgi:hypothetical protein